MAAPLKSLPESSNNNNISKKRILSHDIDDKVTPLKKKRKLIEKQCEKGRKCVIYWDAECSAYHFVISNINTIIARFGNVLHQSNGMIVFELRIYLEIDQELFKKLNFPKKHGYNVFIRYFIIKSSKPFEATKSIITDIGTEIYDNQKHKTSLWIGIISNDNDHLQYFVNNICKNTFILKIYMTDYKIFCKQTSFQNIQEFDVHSFKDNDNNNNNNEEHKTNINIDEWTSNDIIHYILFNELLKPHKNLMFATINAQLTAKEFFEINDVTLKCVGIHKKNDREIILNCIAKLKSKRDNNNNNNIKQNKTNSHFDWKLLENNIINNNNNNNSNDIVNTERSSSDEEKQEYTQRLYEIYSICNTAKIGNIEKLINKYGVKLSLLHDMYIRCCQIYGMPSKDMFISHPSQSKKD